jgi:hypothetical protein
MDEGGRKNESRPERKQSTVFYATTTTGVIQATRHVYGLQNRVIVMMRTRQEEL